MLMRPTQSLLRREITSSWPGACLLGLGLAAALALALPDIVFHYAGFQTTAVGRPETLVIVTVLAAALTLLASRRSRLLVLSLLLVSQLLWLGCLAYFGKPLGPEQLVLATTEATDITWGIIEGWRALLPALLTVTATGGLLTLLLWPEIAGRSWRTAARGWIGSGLLLATAFACAAYWLTHSSVVAAMPGAKTPSVIGPFQASVSALRLLLTPVAAPAGKPVTGQDVKPVALEEEPVTIVVIMGEGISPTRLSVFGFPADTSPRLREWHATPPAGFNLIARIGFSGGVATFGSVPAFLKMAYWPVEAEWRGVNLFDLAHASGFKSWYLSAQSRHFLDVAGGARAAERVVVEQGNEAVLAAKHDDMLTELVREVPSAPKRFVFVHQRVNHANYTNHCSHVSEAERARLYIFRSKTGAADERRRAAYDNGLRCWDRNVAAISEAFLKAPGAVHILITADHSQMMGEDGLWGHSIGDLRVAMVPVLLLTNRPQSDLARRLAALSAPTSYSAAQLVARTLGHEVSTPGAAEDRFFLNNTMPFGRAGYFEVERRGGADFKVRRYSREGKLLETAEHHIAEIETANRPLTAGTAERAGPAAAAQPY
jgi:glucan phosphoethanolaminetransferase (alkaline phosphatase superfamily)